MLKRIYNYTVDRNGLMCHQSSLSSAPSCHSRQVWCVTHLAVQLVTCHSLGGTVSDLSLT